MGMAASQARYLALTARKTNTEWEGQQINQARTALANQSANLFNSLLNLEVPNPPKETDYTEVQYSYDDDGNKSVIEKWDKIGNDNGEYNYVVQHYYMAEIFAGAKKQLQDPQVQLGDVLKTLDYDPATTTVEKSGDNGIKVTYKINNYPYEQKYDKKITQDMIDKDEQLKSAVTSFETAIGFAKADGTLNTDAVYGYQDTDGTWHFFIANNYDRITKEQADADEALKAALTKYELENNLMNQTVDLDYTDVYGTKDGKGNWHFLVKNDDSQITEEKANADKELKAALEKYEIDNQIIHEGEPLSYDNIYGVKENGFWYFLKGTDDNKITEDKVNSDSELKYAFTSYELSNGMGHVVDVLTFDGIFGHKADDGSWTAFTVDKQQTADSFMRAYDNKDYYTVGNEPSFVGNSKLTELNKLIEDKEKGIKQVTELAQILRDCPTDPINQYISFDAQGNLIYEGKGIYTFDLNGKTYYTTKADLLNSVGSSTTAPNQIDTQQKLNYYNATYISKKIEETNNALLETDGKGRFTSVKFDNDSLTHTLKFQEVTNDVAYEDAMNDYLHKKAQYEKTIADINAKTSIIQKEDRTLELRLKQLDTEQNALSTEMDAVKKVIKDNVEKTFKTFSD